MKALSTIAATLHSLEQSQPALPGIIARLFVLGSAGRVLAGAHKAVAGAVVGDGLVLLTRLLHQVRGLRNGRAHASVVSGVEAVHWRLDRRNIVWPSPIKHECG